MNWTKKFILLFQMHLQGAKSVVNQLSGVQAQTKKTWQEMGAFEKAIRRVAVTAPVWMAFRTVVNGLIRGIQDGIDSWIAYDKAITKSTQVIHNSGMSMGNAVGVLKERIEDMAKSSGKSLENLTSAFYRFGTIGIQFQNSMAGMEAATKTALVMFGDVDKIASTMALTYKLLGHTIEGATSEGEKLNLMGAKTHKLWQRNAFEINGFSEALKSALPTMNTLNITYDQTIALLATLHSSAIQNSRAGTMLRTSMMKLNQNFGELASELNMKVNPATDSFYDIFTGVLTKLKEVQQIDPSRAADVVYKVFGGVRSQEAAKGLTQSLELLRENEEALKDPKVLEEFLKSLQEVTDSLGVQQDRNKVLRTEIGRTFVMGVAGGENYEGTLKNINNAMEQLIYYQQEFNKQLQGRPTSEEEKIKLAMEGQLPSGEIESIKNQLEKSPLDIIFIGRVSLDKEKVIADINKQLEEIKISRESYKGWVDYEGTMVPEDYYKKITGKLQEEAEELNKINSELEKKLNLMQQEFKYKEMSLKGYNDEEIALTKLKDHVKELVRLHNISTDAKGESLKKISEDVLLTAVLERNHGKIKDLLIQEKDMQGVITELAKKRNAIEEARIEIQKKGMQNLSSESMKLYEIAQRFGTYRAKQIAELMSGDRSYRDVKYNVATMNVMQEYFPEMVKSFEAKEFFQGFRGRDIPIAERRFPDPRVRSYKPMGREAGFMAGYVPPPMQLTIDFKDMQVSMDIKGMSREQVTDKGLDTLANISGKELAQKIRTDPVLGRIWTEALRAAGI